MNRFIYLASGVYCKAYIKPIINSNVSCRADPMWILINKNHTYKDAMES